MGKQHAPGFLKLVTDAKTRVKECTVDEMRARKAAGESFVLAPWTKLPRLTWLSAEARAAVVLRRNRSIALKRCC